MLVRHIEGHNNTSITNNHINNMSFFADSDQQMELKTKLNNLSNMRTLQVSLLLLLRLHTYIIKQTTGIILYHF